MQILTEDGNRKDVIDLTKVTASNYIVPEDEMNLYHTKIEIRRFDPKTGQRLSVPRIQKFGKKIFESNLIDNLRRQGYEITVLYDPSEWLSLKAEEKRLKAAEKKRIAEEQKAAEIQAAVDAAVAKALEAYEKAHKAQNDKTISDSSKSSKK